MNRTDTYASDIARAADTPRLTPATVRQAQAAMWARHKVAAWQGAPIGTLTAETVKRGTSARVRRVERVL